MDYKNVFAKDYVPNWSEQVLCLKKLKVLCRGHMLLVIIKANKLLERFMKKNCKNKSKNAEFRVEKVIKRKSDKLNSWIDKKRHSINE